MAPGGEYVIPVGSSYSRNDDRTLQSKIISDGINLIGPTIKHQQENNSSCLASSLASSLSFVREEEIARRLLRYYNEIVQNKLPISFEMKHVLQVMLENHGRKKFEKKWKGKGEKVKKPNTMEILLSCEANSIYHCVLINHHAVALVDKWIFDPLLHKAMPRDEKHLRFSSQRENYESSDEIITQCYKYTLHQK